MNFIFDNKKITERDADFVIMRAFAELPHFSDIFLEKIGLAFKNIVSIEHSFSDSDGESDITVIFSDDNKKFALLIENKIDAVAMKDQCYRYTKRGENGKNAGNYDDYAVFIVAPKAYIESNEEAQKYKNHITYEEILEFFISASRAFDSKIIAQAIQKQDRGYTVQEIPAKTDFWKKLYAYCCECGRRIEMYSVNSPKGPRSSWPQFKVPLKNSSLYYKSNYSNANYDVVDLQFNGKLSDALRLKTDLANFLEDEMHWADTGSSISLRINVKKMDFNNPFENYYDELEIMLKAVEKLTILATKLNDIGYIV